MSLKVQIKPIPRAEGISHRLVLIGLGGRFTDELLSGLPAVLMPTIRAQLGLSYTQVSLLGLALNYVAATIEPVGALLIDVWKRPWLMAWGAAGVGLATAVMGLAPTFAILLLGFAIYGLASGPLAHTADVVLVEAYPQNAGRIFARATLLDTVGALLAPLLVSATVWLGLEWRWLLVSLGLSSLVYAVLILRTPFPPPANGHEQAGLSLRQALTGNVKAVLANRAALGWLLLLLALTILETPATFTAIWLREQVGMSQALIGVYTAVQMAVGILCLAVLDRWLQVMSARRILQLATLGLLVLYPAWLFLPGIWTRFALAIPINFLFSVYWPIGKGQSLASAPGRGGTVTAMEALFSFIPFPLLFGLLAQWTTLTTAMFWVYVGAPLLLLLVIWRLPGKE
ncbi:MAG: MFS transporter [Chloroflexi bacterium]|nr:MFS transporter [Chloroflexota bacterium]MCI0578290.1 MFS transporter [Chloroflexota bacterium]MCI0648761.1 MFS transporter [Chloroflexota bacterium]MCI0727229.1 MFS transporter [Chloroflexota bacterium]